VDPEIILGPPGTGKTTRLLSEVERELASGVAPDRIGYVSFTKRAAREAVERACKKFSLSDRDLPHFRTLHSMCFRCLGLSNSDILEGKKVVEFGRWLGIEMSEMVSMEEGSSFGFKDGDRALFMENLSRVRRIPLRQQYDEAHDSLPWHMVERVGRGLSQYKRDHHLVDYTDMLRMFCESDTYAPSLEVLFVDEAQDLSPLQWDVVWKLALDARRVVIAGDDDQAIYRWAGADVEKFVDMDGDVTVLGQSWRVPSSVQAVSAGILSRLHRRRDKAWSPRVAEGVVTRVPDFWSADLSGPDVLVLVRNAFVARSIMPHLSREGVVYEWRGHPSIRQSTVDAVRLWETLRRGEAVTVDEARQVYSLMSSGTGVRRGFKELKGLPPTDLIGIGDLRERGGLVRDDIWHQALERIPADERSYMIRARRRGESLLSRPRVRVSTIHGSKGGEADHVVILTDMAARTHAEMMTSPDDEARVWYVGVTRARERLTIVEPSSKTNFRI